MTRFGGFLFLNILHKHKPVHEHNMTMKRGMQDESQVSISVFYPQAHP